MFQEATIEATGQTTLSMIRSFRRAMAPMAVYHKRKFVVVDRYVVVDN